MKRTSKTVETGSEGQHGRAQCTANQVGGVCANVATLVVGVDGQVETHQLDEILVLAISEHIGQVETVILILLDGSDLAILEYVAVDSGCNGGQLGDQVHRILKGVLPVFLLADTLGVGFGERRLVLESVDRNGELGHWVEVAGAAVDELFDELGHIGTSGPLGRQVAHLLLAGDLTGQEKPEETCAVSVIPRSETINIHILLRTWTRTFWEGLFATGSLWQQLLTVGNLAIVSLAVNSYYIRISRLLTVLPLKRIPSSESRTEPYRRIDQYCVILPSGNRW